MQEKRLVGMPEVEWADKANSALLAHDGLVKALEAIADILHQSANSSKLISTCKYDMRRARDIARDALTESGDWK